MPRARVSVTITGTAVKNMTLSRRGLEMLFRAAWSISQNAVREPCYWDATRAANVELHTSRPWKRLHIGYAQGKVRMQRTLAFTFAFPTCTDCLR